ncbi:MAG: hypothetical protein AB7T06_34655 [Kofleriaceae bacterium]
MSTYLGIGIAARHVMVALLVLCIGSVAHADEEIAKPTKADAKAHLTSGAGLYRAREFEKAIEEFKAGILVEDAPIFHFNLGQSYRQLGKYEDSIWHFERFLHGANPLPAKYKDAVESLVRDMKAELERKAMTRPPTEPADGEGSKEITKPAEPSVPEVPEVPPPSEAAAPWYADGVGWGLVGAGVVGGGVSLFLFVNASSLDDDANKEPSQSRQTELRDQASSRRLIGTIVGVVGAGVLVTGIVKLAITPHRSERASNVSLVFSTNGVAVAGRF